MHVALAALCVNNGQEGRPTASFGAQESPCLSPSCHPTLREVFTRGSQGFLY